MTEDVDFDDRDEAIQFMLTEAQIEAMDCKEVVTSSACMGGNFCEGHDEACPWCETYTVYPDNTILCTRAIGKWGTH